MDVSISAPLDFSLPMRNAIRPESPLDHHNTALLKLLNVNHADGNRCNKNAETNSAFKIVTPKIKIEGKACNFVLIKFIFYKRACRKQRDVGLGSIEVIYTCYFKEQIADCGAVKKMTNVSLVVSIL